MDLRTFYEQEAGEINASDKVPPLSSHGHKVAVKGNDPLSRVRRISQEQNRLNEERKELTDLLATAKGEAGERKDNAIAAIVEKFGKVARKLKVFFVDPVLDAQGREVDKIGMKVITSEKQLETLKNHVEVARQYFPNIEFRMGKDVKDRDIAMVIGIDAIEFNAVILAEKTRQQIERKAFQLKEDMQKAQADLEAKVVLDSTREASGKAAKVEFAKKREEPALG